MKKTVVVAGGGTSGWLAAAALARLIGKSINVVLVESEEIGRIGVGEATIPPLRVFHKLIGIDERQLMREIQATFKLGIEFVGWGNADERYIHSFGVTGKDCWACDFTHFWVRAGGKAEAGDIGEYCAEWRAAKEGKMYGTEKDGLNFAYHLDAGRYAGFLRAHSERAGVKRVEGVITDVRVCPGSGEIRSLLLNNGTEVKGDFFVDCTGFRARLIEGALNSSYVSYREWLPCDSAVAVQTHNTGDPKPYTQAIAHEFGWQWRIPLQHRSGNGLVYCSRYVSDDEALARLLASVEGEVLTEPRAFKYHTGRRKYPWVKNCVAIGLASGFLEPVESTSIHLAMSSILRLVKLFPLQDIRQSTVDEFNRQTVEEMDRVRNFIVLHYYANQRPEPFWRHCRAMSIPQDLERRLALFKDTAACPLHEKELFHVSSWIQVMLGQNIIPESYHPVVDEMSEAELANFLTRIRSGVSEQVKAMPTHQQFIDHYCKAPATA